MTARRPERHGWIVAGIVIAGLVGLVLLAVVVTSLVYANTNVAMTGNKPAQPCPVPLPEPNVCEICTGCGFRFDTSAHFMSCHEEELRRVAGI